MTPKQPTEPAGAATGSARERIEKAKFFLCECLNKNGIANYDLGYMLPMNELSEALDALDAEAVARNAELAAIVADVDQAVECLNTSRFNGIIQRLNAMRESGGKP